MPDNPAPAAVAATPDVLLACPFCDEPLCATSPAHPGAYFHHFNECVLEGFSVVGAEQAAAWNRRPSPEAPTARRHE